MYLQNKMKNKRQKSITFLACQYHLSFELLYCILAFVRTSLEFLIYLVSEVSSSSCTHEKNVKVVDITLCGFVDEDNSFI